MIGSRFWTMMKCSALGQLSIYIPRTAEAVALPLRHWILGEFNSDAYYWPEHHIRFFRKGL